MVVDFQYLYSRWPSLSAHCFHIPTPLPFKMAESIHKLESDWVFKETSGERVPVWLPVQRVPTNVHLDLLHNKV
jgi:hypothetical protein